MKQEIVVSVNDEGKVEGGRKSIAKAFLLHAGKRVRVTIERYVSKRTLPQNAYLHGVVLPLVSEAMTEAGWREAVNFTWTKDFLKKEFLSRTAYNEKTGEGIEYIKDTSALTVSEFMDFIADIQQWASEYLNTYIPDPNEQTEITYD